MNVVYAYCVLSKRETLAFRHLCIFIAQNAQFKYADCDFLTHLPSTKLQKPKVALVFFG
jgi:hypothetical protein